MFLNRLAGDHSAWIRHVSNNNNNNVDDDDDVTTWCECCLDMEDIASIGLNFKLSRKKNTSVRLGRAVRRP